MAGPWRVQTEEDQGPGRALLRDDFLGDCDDVRPASPSGETVEHHKGEDPGGVGRALH